VTSSHVWTALRHRPYRILLKAAVNHGLCDSSKLLYERCAKSMGRPKFRPSHSPTFFNRS